MMDKRWMRWLFGGYRSPEYAVDDFRQIIRNGPQWPRSREAQFLIGKAYEEAEEYEDAVTAYGELLYRYPDSEYAEEASWRRIQCLDRLRMEYPNDHDLLDKLVVATSVFLTTYPKSAHHDEVILLRNNLYEVKAQHAFDIARFYEKVPKNPKAALLCYREMIRQYPKSKLVPEAEKRIAELEAVLKPATAAPAESGKETGESDGSES
jgi:outer membrane protein assembly factor BamD (BamD/ComL family)